MKTIVILLFSTMVIIDSLAQVPSYIPENGLVAWYSFSGSAADESGNNNHAGVTGAQLSSDRFNSPLSAYLFNKDSVQFLSVPSSGTMDSVENLTLTFWTNIASYERPGIGGFNQYINKWAAGIYHYVFANNVIGLYFYYSLSEYYQSLQLPPLNQWSHLALTYDWTGNTTDSWCKFYIDGRAVDSFSVYKPLQITQCSTEIGSFNNTANNTVDGKMDDLGIWKRALTQAEIENIYYSSQTGFSFNQKKAAITVIPNPSPAKFRILGAEEGEIVSIFDLSGRLLMRECITKSDNSIDLRSFSNGVYLLKYGIAGNPPIRLVKTGIR